ncbi:MAG: hypothetical protein R2991_16765 [Thermoanaerobaculia bacterium]
MGGPSRRLLEPEHDGPAVLFAFQGAYGDAVAVGGEEPEGAPEHAGMGDRGEGEQGLGELVGAPGRRLVVPVPAVRVQGVEEAVTPAVLGALMAELANHPR